MKKILLLSLFFIFFAGCSSTYYSAMEKIGYHKRDILSSRVVKARDSQKAAKEQFKTALEKFSDVVDFDGGSLEERYKTLDAEFQKSKKRSSDVSKRIKSVDSVARDLFSEWEDELATYTSDKLRRSSERQLEATKSRYEKLLATMKRAESKIPPVLAAFQDQVLFLKHNLNAQAIASLQSEALEIEQDVARLVREMERSIDEADSFIASLE